MEPAQVRPCFLSLLQPLEGVMATGTEGSRTLVLGIVLGATLVALGVGTYLYWDQPRQKELLKIDVPGFQGTITEGKGIDIEVGKDQD
jgi:hypothetical protein